MKDTARIYVKSLILSQLLLETNDELEGTPFYDTRLNTDVKRVEKTLVKKLSTCEIDDLTMLDFVIDKYLENKNWILENIELPIKPLRNV